MRRKSFNQTRDWRLHYREATSSVHNFPHLWQQQDVQSLCVDTSNSAERLLTASFIFLTARLLRVETKRKGKIYWHRIRFLKYVKFKLLVSGAPHILSGLVVLNVESNFAETKGCVDLWNVDCFFISFGETVLKRMGYDVCRRTKESAWILILQVSKVVTKICRTVILQLNIAFYLSCEAPDCFTVFAAVLSPRLYF